MKTSPIYGDAVKNKQIESVIKAKTFESNISNGRKIFRLLLWLNEIEAIHNVVHDNKMELSIKVLKVISGICSFIYYFTDNIVWFAKIGYLSKFVPFSEHVLGSPLKWGTIKN